MMTNRCSKLLRLTALMLFAAIPTACEGTQKVGSHRFYVPSDNLISKGSYPFFLPQSDEEEFIFILNPLEPFTEQHSVLVQELANICERAKGSDAYVNSTICAPTAVAWSDQKWVRVGDDTFWQYRPKNAPNSAYFVSCHKMEIPGQSGLCHATLPFGDLALDIGFDDDELPTLGQLYLEAGSKLKAWEAVSKPTQ